MIALVPSRNTTSPVGETPWVPACGATLAVNVRDLPSVTCAGSAIVRVVAARPRTNPIAVLSEPVT